MFDIQIYGVKFVKPGQFGDFVWMAQQDEYSDSLFIFNDNEEYHYSSRAGAGNAIMRKFNRHSNQSVPKSAGIPTGTLKNGGYTFYNNHVKKIIDDSINEIIELINKHKYKKLYFSSEPNGLLGTSIFHVNPVVIAYISSKIYNLSNKPVQFSKIIDNKDLFDEIDFNEFDEELEEPSEED